VALCKDSRFADMAHAYQLNALPEQEAERFELHMIDCEVCFAKVQAFAAESIAIRGDSIIRGEVEEVVGQQLGRKSLLQRIWDFFWPDVPFLMKPGIAYLGALLVLAVAIPLSQDTPRIRTLHTVTLASVRSAPDVVLKGNSDKDFVLHFQLDPCNTKRAYGLLIQSQKGSTRFRQEDFRGFDGHGVGFLFLPSDCLEPGQYKLVVFDPATDQDTTIREYSFRVE